jgi:multidrug efflux pump subunit AcrA (membrane-fusion protein)
MLEESGPPRVLAQLLVILSLTIGIGVVWAAVTEITETAIAHGQIMPAGSLYHVEHLEGGIVAEVLVEDGEVVAAGQPLMRLRSAEATTELKRQRAHEAALSLRAERLRTRRGRANARSCCRGPNNARWRSKDSRSASTIRKHRSRSPPNRSPYAVAW